MRSALFVLMATSALRPALGAEPGPTPALDSAIRAVRTFNPQPLRLAIEDLSKNFGDRYPAGSEYLARLEWLEARRAALLASWPEDEAGQSKILDLGRELKRLEEDALLSNPLLDFDRLLVVKRAYRVPTGKKFSVKAQAQKAQKAQKKQPGTYNEFFEGDALGLPVNHNSIFSIRRSGYDNEIAVLSPMRPRVESQSPTLETIGRPSRPSGGRDARPTMSWASAKLSTLFRPKDGVFVGEVDLDFDAQRMLVTMPEDDRWQVFELEADGQGLARITPNEDADVDNYDACYLPDGRIVFASTASYQSVPCWNGLHAVGSLYLLDRRSGKVRQITFDQDDDNYPSILNTGQILFTRWEYANIPHFFGRLLFSMNPDGTDQREYYGSNSYWPNAVYYARAIPGQASKVVGIVSGHHGDFRMGNLAIFDPAQGRQRDQGVAFLTPNNRYQYFDLLNRYPEGVDQPLGYDKQREPILRDRLTVYDWPKFLHPFPLNEHYILVSAKPSPESNWGIYLVDTFGNMTLLHEEDGYAMLEPIPVRPTPRPPVVADRVDLSRKDGIVYLQDVYHGPGLAGVPRGAVKQLRVLAYSFGYRGLSGYDKIGIDGPWDVMRIIGTVPVEADGSASFRAPANTPLSVQPLDERGRALQQMRSWFTLMPGESKSCIGCHESQNSGPPTYRAEAMMKEPAEITPWYGPPRGFDFEREVQPVLDKYCVSCHDGRQTTVAGRSQPDLRALALRPDYRGVMTNVPGWYDPANLPQVWDGELQRQGVRKHVPILFTPAYEALIKYVRRTGPEGDYHLLEPTEYYADTSLLIQILEKGHYGVELDREAWDRLATWIDLNVPCHGTWAECLPIPYRADQRKRELAKKYANLDFDPEAVPAIPKKPVQPVAAREVEVSPGDTKLPGWPFNRYEARLRQQAAGAPTERTIDVGGGKTLKLVLVPAGEFLMGNARDGSPDEWPQARVRIERPFWMGAFEVTNEQFARFDPDHDSRFERAQKMNVHSRGYPMNESRQPVVRVTWHEATAFCLWLSEATGERFTLPTEAQWEYACRAGSAQAMWWGGFNENFGELANMADRSIKGFSKWDFNALNQTYDGWMPLVQWVDDGVMVTSEVGRYAPNPWGLYDMHGNAGEWTLSLYRPYPYRADDGREDPSADGPRVTRGGAWCDLPQFATASYRFGYPAWRKVGNVGFRVVCAIKEPK